MPTIDRFRSVALCAVLVLMSGCGERAPGLIVTADGRMLEYTAETTRAETVRTIDSQLGAAIAPHWHSATTIAEKPVWQDRDRDPTWMWNEATVTVCLSSDGGGPNPVSTEDVRKAVVEYLRPKVVRPTEHLHVRVILSEQTLSAQVPITAPGDPPPHLSRSYTLQAGDTLADISTAFYGSSQYWRLILQANPTFDPEHPSSGTTLTIPPMPETSR